MAFLCMSSSSNEELRVAFDRVCKNGALGEKGLGGGWNLCGIGTRLFERGWMFAYGFGVSVFQNVFGFVGTLCKHHPGNHVV